MTNFLIDPAGYPRSGPRQPQRGYIHTSTYSLSELIFLPPSPTFQLVDKEEFFNSAEDLIFSFHYLPDRFGHDHTIKAMTCEVWNDEAREYVTRLLTDEELKLAEAFLRSPTQWKKFCETVDRVFPFRY